MNNMIFFITILIIFMTFLDPTDGGGCLGGGGGRRRGGGDEEGNFALGQWGRQHRQRERPGRLISNPMPSETVLIEPPKDHKVVVIEDEDRMLDGQNQDNILDQKQDYMNDGNMPSPDGMQKAKNGLWKKSRLRRKMVKQSRMTTKNVSGKKTVNSTNADDNKE
jgi:hypothetical protein